MTEFTTEKKFMVAEGEEGEIYIFIEAKKDSPNTPLVVYDGKDHAIFHRNEEQNIILDYIHPSIREHLRHAPEVIIVEMIFENVKDCYAAKMQYVEKVPVDWIKFGLKTWEEAMLEQQEEK